MRLHIAATHAVSQDASVNIQLSNKRTSSCTRNRGRGVIVYIIDTGCRATHEQLAHTYPHLKVSPTAPFANASDDNGHGTHVAATIAGRDFGLAPEVRLVCIKALSSQNEGRARDVASAIRHVLRTHPRDVPGILSISLGARAPKGYTKLDEMINKAASVGLIPVIAAGNSGISACTYTPARADQAVTVGAATRGGRLAGFSNWGACVGVLAPGVRIWSAWGGGDGLYARASGTSMAAPYVAGLVALALGDGLVSGVVGVKRMLREVSGGAVVSGDAFCEWVERQRRERVSKWGWVRG